ncbi:acyl-coenzyme A thioesterase 9, mitochondrial [Solanum tuberosum]|nr:PREDICTED: acyl-coenzyme A thioesterase 9, mitochondrial [Solanum tuberosum]
MTCFLEFPSSYKIQSQVVFKIKTLPYPSYFQFPRKPFSRIYCLPMESNSSSPNTIPVFSTLASPFDENSDSNRKPLSLWPGMYHSPVTNALWETRSKIFETLLDPPIDAPPQSQLLTKNPSESRTCILYNFSTDFILREQYRDPWNEVRIGKLLEDLDALAGTISVKHCSDVDSMTRPLYLVTASVDKMVLKKPISVDTDLKMVGAVIWVGFSSIEIQLDVIQPANGSSDPSESVALTANFIFVARDYKTGKAAPVNRLCPETEAEKLLYEAAEARNNLRKRKRGGDRKEIENGGVNRLEELLAEGRIFCDMPALADRDTILLKDTRLENSLICQPQQRNIHGRIFGGFLMLRAFELAFSTAYAFAGLMPSFLEVDHVNFLRPVDVGDFLRFKSCVLYTEHENTDQPLINVEVVAHVTRPEQRSSEVSNRFYFTFTVRPEAKATNTQFRIRKVVPATEEEARRVLERMDADHLQSI